MIIDYLNLPVSDLEVSDYGTYYERYLMLHEPSLLLSDALDPQSSLLASTLHGVDDQGALFRYGAGKWSIKEVIMHLIDTERIFNYRALRYARKDKTPLVGFDHDRYAVDAGADAISLDQLLAMFLLQRRNTQAMYLGFDEDMLRASGIANDYEMTVRAIGFFFLGHEKHHVNVIKERYL